MLCCATMNLKTCWLPAPAATPIIAAAHLTVTATDYICCVTVICCTIQHPYILYNTMRNDQHIILINYSTIHVLLNTVKYSSTSILVYTVRLLYPSELLSAIIKSVQQNFMCTTCFGTVLQLEVDLVMLNMNI